MREIILKDETMVLVEAIQAGKANTYPKYVLTPIKMNLLSHPRCEGLDVVDLPLCGCLASLRNNGKVRAPSQRGTHGVGPKYSLNPFSCDHYIHGPLSKHQDG